MGADAKVHAVRAAAPVMLSPKRSPSPLCYRTAVAKPGGQSTENYGEDHRDERTAMGNMTKGNRQSLL